MEVGGEAEQIDPAAVGFGMAAGGVEFAPEGPGPPERIAGQLSPADGAPLPVTSLCERFARQLAGRFDLPVELVDENFSSIEARAVRGGDTAEPAGRERAPGRRIGSGEPVDAEAAAVILRQYLSGR